VPDVQAVAAGFYASKIVFSVFMIVFLLKYDRAGHDAAIKNISFSSEWILYGVSIFPLFGIIIAALNYKNNKPVARICLGIAVCTMLVFAIFNTISKGGHP